MEKLYLQTPGFFYDPGDPDSGIQSGTYVYTICPDGDLYTTIEFIDFFNIGPLI